MILWCAFFCEAIIIVLHVFWIQNLPWTREQADLIAENLAQDFMYEIMIESTPSAYK